MRTQPKIPLRTWAARKWDPPPCKRTLYNWVRNASIEPPPQRVGKTFYVAPDARYTGNQGPIIDGLTPEQWVRGEKPDVEVLEPSGISRLARSGVCGVGVYFLWKGDSLQYVGKSQLVTQRIKEHRRKGIIPFDRYNFLPLEPIVLGITERAYIERYCPPFNKAGKPR